MTQPQKKFSQVLLAWFDKHGRHDLPWQQQITPYRVWVSEIMLQQTQVRTVIPYFQRFMLRFPTLKSLAEASLDAVLQQWTGLGYYARARNLHRCAQEIMTRYHGQFPESLAALISLPGIGRSTAGAIQAIAFKQRGVILDGNVKRVLTRYHKIDGWPGTPAIERQLWELAEQYTPAARTAEYTQAMMDLGATVCTRTQPRCTQCPLQASCQAFQQQCTETIPAPKPAKLLPTRECQVILLRNQQGEILLERRPPVGIWGGLWSLPELPPKYEDIPAWFEQKFGMIIEVIKPHAPIRHSFSHFHLYIHPIEAQFKALGTYLCEPQQIAWHIPEQIDTLGLAAPIKRILIELAVNPLKPVEEVVI